MSLLLILVIATGTYFLALIVFTTRILGLYGYLKQKYPEKLSIFYIASPRRLITTFLAFKSVANPKTIFDLRVFSRLQNAIHEDPILSRDNFLIKELRILRVLQMIEIVIVLVAVIVLV